MRIRSTLVVLVVGTLIAVAAVAPPGASAPAWPSGEMTIAPGSSWSGEVPAVATLELYARLVFERTAGGNFTLEVSVNGQRLTGPLVNKQPSFRYADGRTFPYFDAATGAWMVFFSADFAANNTAAGGGYQVLTDPGQAYHYVWNLARLLRGSSMALRLVNHSPRALVVRLVPAAGVVAQPPTQPPSTRPPVTPPTQPPVAQTQPWPPPPSQTTQPRPPTTPPPAQPAQPTQPPTPPTQPVATHDHGVGVWDKAGRVPMAWVRVRVGSTLVAQRTDQDGVTRFRLPAGTYTFEASKPGYTSATQTGVPVPTPEFGPPMPPFVLERELYTARVRVVDENGQPVPGARVTFGGPYATSGGQQSTDNAGIVVERMLENGVYTVTVEYDSHVRRTLPNIVVPGMNDIVAVTTRRYLPAPPVASGFRVIVRDETGAFLSNVVVRAGTLHGNVEARTDRYGTAQISGLKDSLAQVSARLAGYRDLENYQVQLPVPYVLQFQLMRKIDPLLQVAVMDQYGLPIPGATVHAAGATAKSGTNGIAELRLPQGEVAVGVELAGHGPAYVQRVIVPSRLPLEINFRQ